MVRRLRIVVAMARAHPGWLDLALAVVLSVIGVWLAFRTGASSSHDGTVATTPAGPDPSRPRPDFDPDDVRPFSPLAGAVVGVLVTGPLAVRRRWALLVFPVQLAAALAIGSTGSGRVAFVAVAIGVYSVAAYGRWPVLSMGVLLGGCTLIALTQGRVSPPVPDWAGSFAIVLPIALFGLTIRAVRARAEASAQRAAALEAGQEAATRAATAQERARIARELHDVVSHHVSVMVIQAGAAEKVIGERPDLARESLLSIASSGREAMGELRHLLGVLTPAAGEHLDGPGCEPLRPQPGLHQLDALVDHVRAAGQPVTLRQTRGRDLPRGVDSTAYRVVQEALTNALRYAPGAPTEVVLDRDGDVLLVEVVDNGTATRPPPTVGRGAGLLGLAERLSLYGATLETERRPGGGFRVAARIPLP